MPLFLASITFAENSDLLLTYRNVNYTFALSEDCISWDNKSARFIENVAFKILFIRGSKEETFEHNSWYDIDWHSNESIMQVKQNYILLQDIAFSESYYTIFIKSYHAFVGLRMEYRSTSWFELCPGPPYNYISYYFFAVSAWQFKVP